MKLKDGQAASGLVSAKYSIAAPHSTSDLRRQPPTRRLPKLY